MSAASKRIVLAGMGHYFPPTVIDNDFFAELDIGSSSSWIDERVGIKERRTVLSRDDIMALRHGRITRAELVSAGKIMSVGKMCKEAYEMAWTRAHNGRSACHIDTLIAGTSVPDWDIPANACAIAGELSLECTAFDVNSACSSFVVNLHVARGLMKAGHMRSIAICNPERYTTRVNYADRGSSVLFGDSAAVGILDSANDIEGLELIDTIVRSSPVGYQHVQLPDGGVFYQNGQAVQKFAITKTIAITLEILEKHGMTKSDISYFIGHQANLRMLMSACEKQGIGPDRHLFNVDTKGNQGAAGAPTVLSTNWEKFKSGDIIVVAVVGSGLTWGAALFRKI